MQNWYRIFIPLFWKQSSKFGYFPSFLIKPCLYLLSNFEKNNFKLFLILCLSNQVLFFDNLEPIDYSWALLPFLLVYFFFKKRYELAILFFGISIGSRINFFLFIIPVVLFFLMVRGNNMADKLSQYLLYFLLVHYFIFRFGMIIVLTLNGSLLQDQ